jgi:hypothetical protein
VESVDLPQQYKMYAIEWPVRYDMIIKYMGGLKHHAIKSVN